MTDIYAEAQASLDGLSDTVMQIKAERDRYKVALELIAAMAGKCLIAPSLGPDCDRAYQSGSNYAFEQAAGIAISALSSHQVQD